MEIGGGRMKIHFIDGTAMEIFFPKFSINGIEAKLTNGNEVFIPFANVKYTEAK